MRRGEAGGALPPPPPLPRLTLPSACACRRGWASVAERSEPAWDYSRAAMVSEAGADQGATAPLPSPASPAALGNGERSKRWGWRRRDGRRGLSPFHGCPVPGCPPAVVSAQPRRPEALGPSEAPGRPAAGSLLGLPRHVRPRRGGHPQGGFSCGSAPWV